MSDSSSLTHGQTKESNPERQASNRQATDSQQRPTYLVVRSDGRHIERAIAQRWQVRHKEQTVGLALIGGGIDLEMHRVAMYVVYVHMGEGDTHANVVSARPAQRVGCDHRRRESLRTAPNEKEEVRNASIMQ